MLTKKPPLAIPRNVPPPSPPPPPKYLKKAILLQLRKSSPDLPLSLVSRRLRHVINKGRISFKNDYKSYS